MPLPGPLELILIMVICAVPIAVTGVVIFFVLNQRKRVDDLEKKVNVLHQKMVRNTDRPKQWTE